VRAYRHCLERYRLRAVVSPPRSRLKRFREHAFRDHARAPKRNVPPRRAALLAFYEPRPVRSTAAKNRIKRLNYAASADSKGKPVGSWGFGDGKSLCLSQALV
jgi:hypothetical protein